MSGSTSLLLNFNRLQIHYWFSDRSHTMDALVHNKCEREILELTKAIASLCGVQVKMETEPSAKGGLRGWISLTPKSEKKANYVRISLVKILVMASMNSPISRSIGSAARSMVDALEPEKELSEDERNQWNQGLNQLKEEISSHLTELDQSSVIKKRRSNFYELLRKYPKIKKVSWTLENSARKQAGAEQVIERDDFEMFILATNQVQPQVLENVSIEIISPVLGNGKFKWKGLYNGSPISFNMKSDEFMSLVHSGKVEFKSGTTITCTLAIEKKINSVGAERITGYNILEVKGYQEANKVHETMEAKSPTKKPVVARKQLNLFGE